LWDIAKTQGRVVQPIKWLHVDKAELERYLRVVDDFVQRHEYKTSSTLTLWRLAKGVIV
jgi:hypothetical protein